MDKELENLLKQAYTILTTSDARNVKIPSEHYMLVAYKKSRPYSAITLKAEVIVFEVEDLTKL